MAKNCFEDHLHPLPEEGVPYAPAWDGAPDECCLAWMAYVPGRDLLKGRLGHAEFELCRAPAVGKPAVLQVGPRRWQVAAPVFDGSQWRCRRFAVNSNGVQELTEVAVDAGFLETVRLGLDAQGRILMALAMEHGGAAGVRLLRCDGDTVETVAVSPDSLPAYRPVPAVVGGNPGVIYDAWDGEAYHVYMQQCGDAPVRISEGQGWHIAPDIVVDADNRLVVAWVRTTDVISPDGVLDARCELMLARLNPNPPQGPEFERFGPVDDLSHGLLDTCPGPKTVWGYCGRRRHPMLLRTPGGVELLWEQKAVHEGLTRKNYGILWARSVTSEGVGEARAIMAGGLAYEIPGSHSVAGPIAACCMEGMFTDDRRVVLKSAADTRLDARRLEREAWRGWQAVTLPLPEMCMPERPTVTVGEKSYSLYWFDLHCHTVLSADAEGEVDECYRTARHKALLDGMLVTDNDHYIVPLTHNEWRVNCAMADAFNVPGSFVALIGYEWTSCPILADRPVTDHRSVLLVEATDDIVRWNEVAGDNNALYDFVEKHGGFTHAHHQTWRLRGHPVEVNIEAASSWDAYLERDPSGYHEALAGGQKIGVIGGSDEHRRNPGLGGALTGIWAESLTRESILEALRARRCVATSGHRIMIDFRANEAFIGETLCARDALMEIRVVSPAPLVAVELWRDGVVAQHWDATGKTAFETTWLCSEDVGTHTYYVKVQLEGVVYSREELPANLQQALGPHAWSSPIWVKGES